MAEMKLERKHDLIGAYNNMAVVEQKRGNLETAEMYYFKSMKILYIDYKPNFSSLAYKFYNLALLHAGNGNNYYALALN